MYVCMYLGWLFFSSGGFFWGETEKVVDRVGFACEGCVCVCVIGKLREGFFR